MPIGCDDSEVMVCSKHPADVVLGEFRVKQNETSDRIFQGGPKTLGFIQFLLKMSCSRACLIAHMFEFIFFLCFLIFKTFWQKRKIVRLVSQLASDLISR